MFKSFLKGNSQEIEPFAEKGQDRKTRQKNKRGDRKEKSKDSPEIPDWLGGGGGGGYRHPRPPFETNQSARKHFSFNCHNKDGTMSNDPRPYGF